MALGTSRGSQIAGYPSPASQLAFLSVTADSERSLLMLTRRQFVVGAATIMGAGVRGSRQPGKAEALYFQTTLPIPKLTDAARVGNSVRLRAASARHSFFNGKPAPTYGYSASILGPALRLRRGDEVEMVVENALNWDTTVH